MVPAVRYGCGEAAGSEAEKNETGQTTGDYFFYIHEFIVLKKTFFKQLIASRIDRFVIQSSELWRRTAGVKF